MKNVKVLSKYRNYYDEMSIKKQSNTFQFEEDLFSRNTQSISKVYHEVFLLLKILQTEPQDKNMNNKFFDFYYTVIKIRNDKQLVNDEYEKNEIEYVNSTDFF